MSRELFSDEAEFGILGAVLLKPELFDEISSKVDVSDFHDLESAALYQVMIDCHTAGVPIDVVTLSDCRHRLPSGKSTLAHAGEVAMSVPSAANWKAYARIVRERAVLRQIVNAAYVINDTANEERPLSEVIAMAQQATADLRDLDDDGQQDYYKASEILPAVIDTIDSKFNKTMPTGLSTGLKDLDELVRGLRPGNMIVVGGLTGSGKTILGLQIAQHVTCNLDGVGLAFSMEMTKEELITRGLASIGSVNLSKLDSGDLEDHDWPKLTSAVSVLNEAKLFVNDQAGMTMPRIRSIARQCQRREGLNVLLVDYVQLISAEGSANRSIEVGKISTALKNLAKELKIPVIVLAQLNRGSTNRPDKRPRPSDIRDSGQIEQDADVVILVHRDMESEEGQNGVTELIVGKVRHAKVGSCLVQQQGKYVRFVDFGGKAPSTEEVEMGRVLKFTGRAKERKDHE
ncbi:replicative DNA helicase [Pseudomonas trivialis]|uniref:DNA 5'-3' helicase n=1 Tax=Pseudomonas trivialis TaxID=200450 RepID=A0A0R2ZH22_9PSED|nr:replicative DNA helicase [Pseudomonas trivialis]KRP60325.1 helicase DnaB [Pseudomonas trivialis]SDT07995.1 replicative DNA helicase [Pseudomonas trivialis]